MLDGNDPLRRKNIRVVGSTELTSKRLFNLFIQSFPSDLDGIVKSIKDIDRRKKRLDRMQVFGVFGTAILTASVLWLGVFFKVSNAVLATMIVVGLTIATFVMAAIANYVRRETAKMNEVRRLLTFASPLQALSVKQAFLYLQENLINKSKRWTMSDAIVFSVNQIIWTIENIHRRPLTRGECLFAGHILDLYEKESAVDEAENLLKN